MRPKAKSERLTEQRISAFAVSPGKHQSYLWDTESPRLAVRATAGSKSFVFEGKLNRQTIRITIGDTRNWSIEDARSEARRYQVMLDKKIDPREQAREEEEAKAAAKQAAKEQAELEKRLAEHRVNFTLRKLCAAYVDYLAAIGKSGSSRQANSVFKCHLLEVFPEFADLPASEVTSVQIATVVRKALEKGKVRVPGTLRTYLSAAYNCAAKAETDSKIPTAFIGFGIKTNPVEVVSTIPVNTSDRTLSPDEIKTYVTSLGDTLPDLALKLAIYSGSQRMAQLLRIKKSDIYPDIKAFRIWDGKGRRAAPREHVVPLATKGASILAQLMERAQDFTGEYLLSVTGEQPIHETAPGKRLTEIQNENEMQPFDLRDIRRTVETVLASMGFHKDIRGRLLSHGVTGVQDKNYDRFEYLKEKRAALAAWERRIKEFTSDKQPGNVVSMNDKRKKA